MSGWVALAGAIGVMLYLGWRARHLAQSEEGFLVAGRTLGAFVAACTILATNYSGWAYMGSAGVAYEFGTIGLVTSPLWLMGMMIGVLFFGSYIRRRAAEAGSLTVPEYAAQQHGDSSFVRSLAAVLTILLLTTFLVGQMTAMGLLMGPVLNMSYENAVFLLGVIVILYTVLGGLAAVAWTDTLQTVGMTLGALVVLWVVFQTGGFSSLFDTLAGFDPKLVNPPDAAPYGSVKSAVLLYVPYSFAFLVALPYMANRFLAVRADVKWHKMGVYVLPLAVLMAAAPIAGMIVRAYVQAPLDAPDEAMPTFLSTFLPPSAFAVIAVFILFAMKSTADSVLHAVGSAFSYDLRKVIFKETSERAAQRANRGAVVFVGAVAMAFAITSPPPFLSWLGILGSGTLMAALIGPFFVSTFWRGNSIGAISSMVLGSGTTALLMLTDTMGWIESPLVGMVVGMATYVAVSSLTTSIAPVTAPAKAETD